MGGDLRARVFLGKNTHYFAEFASHPSAFFPPNRQPDPTQPGFNYISFSNLNPLTTVFPVRPLPGTPVDGEDNIADLLVDNATLELLAAGRDSVPIVMQVITLGDDGLAEYSHIPGAGEFLAGLDHPFSVYFSSASSGPCACNLAGVPRAHAGRMIVLFAAMVLCVSFRSRR